MRLLPLSEPRRVRGRGEQIHLQLCGRIHRLEFTPKCAFFWGYFHSQTRVLSGRSRRYVTGFRRLPAAGSRCELEINECLSSPCLNAGACEDQTGGYVCNCPVGFSGDHCEVDVDECYSAPCLNGGHCQDGVDSFR